jgi:hypothetical protein
MEPNLNKAILLQYSTVVIQRNEYIELLDVLSLIFRILYFFAVATLSISRGIIPLVMIKEQTMATAISTITPEQLHAAQLRGDQPALLDVHTAAEYRASHIPGAQLLPDGELRPDEVTRRFKQAAPGHQEPCTSHAGAGRPAAHGYRRARQPRLWSNRCSITLRDRPLVPVTGFVQADQPEE